MTLDSDDTVDSGVLHRVLDGLRRMPDQRSGSDASDRDDAPAHPRGDDGDGVLPRRRHP